MFKFNWYTFSELTSNQLYEILKLRAEIFVVEQKCAYLDPDGKDIHALHLLGMENHHLVAYLRLFLPTETQKYIIFGRIVTTQYTRKKGYGKKLMHEMLDYCETNFPHIRIDCSAQYHLKSFYESFGFKTFGEPYDEDGILHIGMRKN